MRLIDADALKVDFYDEYETEDDVYTYPFVSKDQIDSAPSIDIVHCRECKWADWYKTADGEQFCYCMETGNGGRTADDFCSYGERREP